MNERATFGQWLQVGFMIVVIVVGLIGSLLYFPWWVTAANACLVTSFLMMGSQRIWLLTPKQINGEARQGRGPSITLISQGLLFSGLALLLWGWFVR